MICSTCKHRLFLYWYITSLVTTVYSTVHIISHRLKLGRSSYSNVGLHPDATSAVPIQRPPQLHLFSIKTVDTLATRVGSVSFFIVFFFFSGPSLYYDT